MRVRFVAVTALLVLMLLGTVTGQGTPLPAHGGWAPELYPIAMGDAKHRTLPEQARVIRELGFDGVGYQLWLDESLVQNLRTLDEAGLELYMVYSSVSVDPKKPPYTSKLPDAIAKLKGRPVTICVILEGLPPGDPGGEEQAIQALRQLGDIASENGLRISIYHHISLWTHSLFDALRVVKKVDHPNVGVSFNLCHWLWVDGGKDYRPVLRENAAKIFAVSINGAGRSKETGKYGAIQPLDRGDFDNRGLLATLRDIGYRGPVALQCYGIRDDARDHLARSMRVWRALLAEGVTGNK